MYKIMITRIAFILIQNSIHIFTSMGLIEAIFGAMGKISENEKFINLTSS